MSEHDVKGKSPAENLAAETKAKATKAATKAKQAKKDDVALASEEAAKAAEAQALAAEEAAEAARKVAADKRAQAEKLKKAAGIKAPAEAPRQATFPETQEHYFKNARAENLAKLKKKAALKKAIEKAL